MTAMQAIALVAAYLLGSVPFGYVVVRLGQGQDVREGGSGNIGATNVMRTSGPLPGILTLLLDTAKGLGAVWVAGRMTDGDIKWMAGAGLAAILGHMFPVWLKFRGGKGVATGAGAFLMIAWPAVAAAVIVWAVVVAFWRFVSLGSIAATAALPLLVYFLYAPPAHPPLAVSVATTLAAILIIWKHRTNIERLLAGTEHRLKVRK